MNVAEEIVNAFLIARCDGKHIYGVRQHMAIQLN